MPKINYLLVTVALFFSSMGMSQTNVNTIGTAVQENFNSLPSSGSAASWSQNSTVSGWYAYETDPYRVAVSYIADSGASNTGRVYSYGRAGSSERALGSLGSGSTDSIVYGWRLKNNTGKAITSINVSYTGEQWRRGANTATNKLAFFYKVASSITSIDSLEIKNLSSSSYVSISSLDFTSPSVGAAFSITNGNDNAFQTKFNQDITVNIPIGYEIMIMWFDDDDASNDHGLAIDDISVTFSNVDKSPPTVNSVTRTNTTDLKVVFSEPVKISTAIDTSNYKLSPYVKINSLSYDSVTYTVTLKANMIDGKNYQLTVNNLIDRAPTPNTMTTPSVTKNLIYNGYNNKDLVISEIHYNDPSANDNYEFIEITNSSAAAIELGGLSFTTGITYLFEEYSLGAGKSISIAKIVDSCSKQFSTTFLGPFSGSLNNSGELVVLANSNNQVVDSVKYSDVNGWPSEADGQGPSLQLKTPYFNSAKNDVLMAWGINYSKAYSFQLGTTIWATPNFVPTSFVNISEITKNDSNGVNTTLNTKVEIRGTVYGVNFDSLGLSFVIRDLTGGIFAASFTNLGYTVKEGDSLRLVGKVNQLFGMNILSIDTLQKRGTSKLSLKTPTTILLPEEKYEADVVKIFNLKLAQSVTKWPANGIVKLYNGKDTIYVFIDKETNIDGTNLPSATSFNLTGFVIQNSKSSKLNDGYMLALRSTADIDFVAAPDPEVYFTMVSGSISEKGVGTVIVKINNANSTATNLSVRIKGGTATSATDYTNSFPKTITFPANSSADQSLTVNLINDIMDEPNETIQFVIRNADNKAKILKDSIFTLIIQDDDAPLYKIRDITRFNATTGIPDSMNAKAQIRGIVYGFNILPTALEFTVIDSTGGLHIFNSPGNKGYVVAEGDDVQIAGTITHFRGWTELIKIDTIVKFSSGNALQKPKLVKKLNESTESRLVKIKGLRWAQTKPSTWTANTNFRFTNGIDTFTIRIDADVNVAGKPIPTYDTLNIAGIGAQFSSSTNPPFLNGYQLFPRYIEDIEKYNSRIYLISLIKKSNASGVPDSSGVLVNVRGVVYGINYNKTGLSFTLRDNSGGLNVFHPAGNKGYTVKEGDEVSVWGVVGQFRGLARIEQIDTIIVTKTNQTLKTPSVVTSVTENTESDLVVIRGYRFSGTKPTTWVANTSYLLTNGTNIVNVFIDDDNNLAGTPTPTYDTMSVTGLGWQVSVNPSGPYNDGYMLYPRSTADVVRFSKSSAGKVQVITANYSVYPNPTKGNFTIAGEKVLDKIEIYSLSGQLVYTEANIKMNTVTLSISLTAGIYSVKTYSENAVSNTKLIVQ